MARDRERLALAGLAVALAGPATPRAEFRDALRHQLLASANTQVLAPPNRRGSRVPRWAAAGLAGGLAASAVGVAANQALPGQPFFDFKEAAETAQMQFAHGDEAKGSSELAFATTRLSELRRMGAGGPQLGTLGAMDRATVRGSAYLRRAAEHGDRKAAPTLTTFARRQGTMLATMMPAMASEARQRARQSEALLSAITAGEPVGQPGAPTLTQPLGGTPLPGPPLPPEAHLPAAAPPAVQPPAEPAPAGQLLTGQPGGQLPTGQPQPGGPQPGGQPQPEEQAPAPPPGKPAAVAGQAPQAPAQATPAQPASFGSPGIPSRADLGSAVVPLRVAAAGSPAAQPGSTGPRSPADWRIPAIARSLPHSGAGAPRPATPGSDVVRTTVGQARGAITPLLP